MVQKKRAVRIAALLLVFAMMLPHQAFAAENRASSNIQYCVADLSLDQNGDLYIFFSIMASSTMDKLGASSIKIQRYTGSNWITEQTLVPRDFPDMQSCNADRVTVVIPYTPNYSEAYYRAVVSAYAETASGTSTDQATSREIRT